MSKKKLNKTVWYGSDIDSQGNAILPPLAEGREDLNGIHEGEFYLHNDDKNPAIFIRTTANRIVAIGGIDIEELKKMFLRKDKDDTAKGVITFENQIKSHDFAQGNLMGAGWSIYRDGNGNVVVETDRMIIRKDLSVSELIVNQETFQKGSTIYVKGGCTITRVEEADTYYRCYFDNKDGEEFSGFVVGDQARCQRYDKSYQNVIKYYWRLVVGVGDDYVDLSKTDSDGTGLPTEGDDIAQLGNRTDKTRQSAVVISPDSGGSVVIWAGINSFNLSEKNMIGMGVDASTGEAYFYGYGNMYMGDRNQTSFMRFTKNNGVEICGSLAVGTKLGDGRDLKEAIDSATPEGYQEFVSAVTKSLGDLQNQVDGAVDSFFLDYDPTLGNYPASEWTTDAQKEAHLGDTFTNNTTGDSWRWGLVNGSYQWIYIEDTATKKALAEASKAKDVADGKRRVFTSTPKYTDSYDVGDLWVNATYGQYFNEILKCNTAKAANVAFDIAHWSKASKYTDDSSVNALKVDVNALSGKVDKFGTDIEAVKQQTDREYTIWFFEYEPTLNNYPASDWTTPELVAEHDQDMFYYREAGKAWRFEDGAWKLIKDQDVLRALEQIAALQTQISDLEPLREAFKDDETLVSGGLVMASLVGVRNKENEVESFLNGSDFAKDETHGKLLLAGGIPSGTYSIEERAKAALTRIYEDGTFYSAKGIFGGYIKSNLVRILESDAIVVTGLYNNHAYKLVDNLYVDATFAEIVLPSGDKYSGARAIIIDSYFLKARLSTTPTIIRDENGEGILCGLLDNGDAVEPHSISAIRIEGGAVELIHKNVIIGKNDSGGDIYESRWVVLTHSCATFEIYNG